MTNASSTRTLTFNPTTYNLVNGLNQDLVYNQKVFFDGIPQELNGIITVYDIPNDGIENAGPQQYLNILINPNLAQGTPSNTPNAPYGLTDLIGSVYLYDVFKDDGNGNLVYDSSQGNTNPDAFPFLKQNYPELPLGYIALQGSGPNKLFGQETANITQTTDPDGVIHITNVGTIDITGGEGIFQGATGVLEYIENGISGLPYTGKITIEGNINLSDIGNLKSAYIIGQDNFDSWSQGFDADGYLKVLPHPDQKVAYKDPFLLWQQDNQNYKNGDFVYEGANGEYYSSWGPREVLELTLNVDELQQLVIDGFGILEQGDHFIDWLDKATPYDILRAYNGKIPGPMLITEPGDTIKITLNNNLDQVINLHTHGLHVSPVGNGDNVLISVPSGGTWETEIKIPEDHFIGPDWYHPHLHGETNVHVASGLGGYLLINPPYDLPDLEKFDPVTSPSFFMAIQSFGIQQQYRGGSPNDPLNQSSDPNILLPAGTPLDVKVENQKNVYSLSESPFLGYNGKPELYNPLLPLGSPPPNLLNSYGQGALAEPTENVIHTVNGQYNPTIDTTTGAWNLFSFGNFTVNSFYVIQLLKEETDGSLTPQDMLLTAIDGDAAGVVEGIRRELTVSPVLNPGSRISLQNWFEEPGKYYFLANATEEVLGENAPAITQNKGFSDGHLIWGSQVLATIEVTGNSIPTGAFPEAYDVLIKQSDEINALVDNALNNGVTQERTFVWSANVGGALSENRFPTDTDVTTFEGTYRINGEYFATQGGGMPPLTMPMLGSTEIWNVQNTSGLDDEKFKELGINAPLLEWHPFHIHQNDFVVLEINGIPVEQIQNNYLARVLSDTIALPPSYAPGSVTPENPYGTPQLNGTPSEVKILMEFADYPGAYVNHCHILFHEDAGMMAVVKVILNTEKTWLGLSNEVGSTVTLLKASNTNQNLILNAYDASNGVEVAIADVNYKNNLGLGNTNVTDNVTDIVTIQKQLTSLDQRFTIKVFDGKSTFDKLEQGNTLLQGNDSSLLLAQITPFVNTAPTLQQQTAIATGDIDGDGFADIVTVIGGGVTPLIEVYSGKNYQFMASIAPFHHENFKGNINVAVGDVNGDNFYDILVSQGEGGRGLVEAYDGKILEGLIRSGISDLTAKDVAHETAFLHSDFQPYGDFSGEVKITSGYALQTPQTPNGSPSQTSAANITTLAVGDLPQVQQRVKIHTLISGHGSHSSSTVAASTSESEHNHDTSMEVGTTSVLPDTIKLSSEFTPNANLNDLDGTFADIKGVRGQGVIFAKDTQGNQQLIQLQEDNIPQSTVVEASSVAVLFNTPLYRFQNQDIPTTYLYAGEQEAENIRQNFPNFQEEGFAFNGSETPTDQLISLYRFQNMNVIGTYLYVGEQERQSVLQNYPNFKEEGLAFYAFGVGSNQGQDIYRFQNTDVPGTYLFLGENELPRILAINPNFW
ncbi:multicopper oxidase domain-containing protein [Geminocystis sp. GBBB08]|uniref:multicopper oxidase domain-containing protein n=1 Tax=Geminocystis sp. GBBB08 TaxID=2604140 RepID=UPI0027E3638C|nr:multicopper oxidase domain-containing protein [Geminocystis sp. GBBB08]